MKIDNYGIVRVAVASPIIEVGNPEYNIIQIEKLIKEAEQNDSCLIVFPELSITGYTCGDLFLQRLLIDKAQDALIRLIENTKDTHIIALVGMPIIINGRLYNCAVAIQSGKILGIVPKMFVPNYKEFDEKRWFDSGIKLSKDISEISINGENVPFGNLIFCNEEMNFSFGIEISEDLLVPIPPSSYLTSNGAMIIANLSASNELISRSSYRRKLIASQSARGICGYLYSSSGVYESTTDVVFGGDCLIADNGSIIKDTRRFVRDNVVIYAEIDTEKLALDRQLRSSFGDLSGYNGDRYSFKNVRFKYTKNYDVNKFDLHINPYPFIPKDDSILNERCEEVFNIQVAGLAKRLEHTKTDKVVIGISGGLDSTLALLAVIKTFDVLNIPRENIHGITMPGFGTTDESFDNAIELMKILGITIKEVDIKPACLQHFEDIGHDKDIFDVTYENVQARERTQILMDYANKIRGFVIGTGDLSELVLGWCTYNGDHMSMYAVNSSIPKTLVKFLVDWFANNALDNNTKQLLKKIVNMPISPELLPPDKEGKIKQKTEDIIGPYALHDFFIYYCLRYGMMPRKILFFAKNAFNGKYTEEEIRNWLKVFYKRFFSQQFKRSCMPDGPKVGTVCVSPRGNLKMPSDADASLWLNEL